MKELHSWCGLLSGWVLFAVCLTGALTVFDTDITYWMQPELLEVSANTQGFYETVPLVAKSLVQVDRWDRSGLTDRASVLVVKLHEKRTFSGQTLNPVTGETHSGAWSILRHPHRLGRSPAASSYWNIPQSYGSRDPATRRPWRDQEIRAVPPLPRRGPALISPMPLETRS